MKENLEGQGSLKDIYDRKLAELKSPHTLIMQGIK